MVAKIRKGHEHGVGQAGGTVPCLRRQGVGSTLRRAQLRRLSRFLQTQHPSQPGVRLQGARQMRRGRRKEEPVPGMQAQEVPSSLYAEGR
ncbi:hypothetical protein TNCV_1023711 [Trichonephila clavipes]|nr:hypothetical protein TNCV_1023711 [Trichonephila clavipes]